MSDENIFPCPSCGEDCHEGDEQCPHCGEDLTSYDESPVDNEEDTIISKSTYEIDEDDLKPLIRVINKCIEPIACECDFYDSEAIEDDDNEDIVDAVLENIADDCDVNELVGIINTSSSEEGSKGFVFTKIGIIEKGDGYKLNLPYKAMGDMNIDDGKLTFLGTKGFGSGTMKDKDVYIEETYYDIDALMRLCERIVSYLGNN